MTNTGEITSAMAELKAHGNVGALAVNNAGAIRVTGVQTRGGKVVLSANQGNISNTGAISARNGDGSGGGIEIRTGMGEIQIGGILDASGNGPGGSVNIVGRSVDVLPATMVNASGDTGGSIQMSADANGRIDVREGSQVVANGRSGGGGMVDLRAGDIVIYGNSTLGADGETEGGILNIIGSGLVSMEGNASAVGRAGNGGRVAISGENVLISETGNIQANGMLSGGVVGVSAQDDLLVAGSVAAVADGGTGGTIGMNASNVVIAATGSVNASGSDGGGTVMVNASDQATVMGSVSATGGDGAGGNISFTATDLLVGPTGLIDAGGNSGGTVSLDATDTTTVNGQVQAIGSEGAGGTVSILGDEVTLGATAIVDVGGAAGGGNAYIGGGYQGQGTSRNASNTTVAAGAQIRASSSNGNAGSVIVWADDETKFSGNIIAKGGEGARDGFVEVSGKEDLTFNGVVEAGTLLLDPTSITMDAAMATALRATLEGGTDTIVHTNFGTGATGNINIISDLRYGADADLAFFANNSIFVTASVQNHGAGNITLGAGWTPGASGTALGAGVGNNGIVGGTQALDFETIMGGTYGTFGAERGNITVGNSSREVEIGSAAGETNLIADNISVTADANREDQVQIGYRRTRKFVNNGAYSDDFSDREVEVSGDINLWAEGNISLAVGNSNGNPARQPVIVGHGGQSFGAWGQQNETLTGLGDSFSSTEVYKDYVVLGYIDNSQVVNAGNQASAAYLGFNTGTDNAGLNVSDVAAGWDGSLGDLINDGTNSSGSVAHQGDTLLTLQRTQSYSGDITVSAGGTVLLAAGEEDSFVQVGHTYQGEHMGEGSQISNNLRRSGGPALINMQGDITVKGDLVAALAGYDSDSRVQIGHGGRNVRGVFSGVVDVYGERGVLGRANTRSDRGGGLDYVQIGHGGYITRHVLSTPGMPTVVQRLQVNNINNTGNTGAYGGVDLSAIVGGYGNHLPNNHILHVDFAFGDYDTQGGNVNSDAGTFGAANTTNANFVSLYDPDGDGIIDALPTDATDFNYARADTSLNGVLPSESSLRNDNPGGFTSLRANNGNPPVFTEDNQFDGGRDAGDGINRTPDAIIVNGTQIVAAGQELGYSGNIFVRAPSGSVTFESGTNTRDWAMIGHGGDQAAGSHIGDITVEAGGEINEVTGNPIVGNVSFLHRSVNENNAYGTIGPGWGSERAFNQIGHGGFQSSGSHSGDIKVDATGELHLEAGQYRSWAQVGHGGWDDTNGDVGAQGTLSGNITINTGRDVRGRAGFWREHNWVQIGHGGFGIEALAFEGHNGNISVISGGMVDFFAGSTDMTASLGSTWDRYAQIGHGGWQSRGDHWGDITVSGKEGVYLVASAGYDGWANDTDFDGGSDNDNLHFETNGRIQPGYGNVDDATQFEMLSRTWAEGAYAQIGHGGRDSDHQHGESGSNAVGIGILGRMADHNSNLFDGNDAILAEGADGYVASDIAVYAGIDPTTGAVTNPGANIAIVGPNHGFATLSGATADARYTQAIDDIHMGTNLPTLRQLLGDPNAPDYVLNPVPVTLSGHVNGLFSDGATRTYAVNLNGDGDTNDTVGGAFEGTFGLGGNTLDQRTYNALSPLGGLNELDPSTWTAANLNAASGGMIDEVAALRVHLDAGGTVGTYYAGLDPVDPQNGPRFTPTIATGMNRVIIDGFADNISVQDSNTAGFTAGSLAGATRDMNGHAIDLDGDDIADAFIIAVPDLPTGHVLAGNAPNGDLRLGTPLPWADDAYAQVGHGGRDTGLNQNNFRIAFTSQVAAANGGTFEGGGHKGNITMEASGSISMVGSDLERVLFGETNQAGDDSETSNQHRHGGQNPSDHWNMALPNENYLQIGHGGQSAKGTHSGNINLSAINDIFASSGANIRSSTHIGHGGWDADRDSNVNGGAAPLLYSGDITLTARDGDVILTGDRELVVTGNKSTADDGTDGGHNNLIAGLAPAFQPGGELNQTGVVSPFAAAFAGSNALRGGEGLLGDWTANNRGIAFDDPLAQTGQRIFDGRYDYGSVGSGELQAGLSVSENNRYAYLQVGHGGINTDADIMEGDITVTSGGRIDLIGGNGLGDNYALIGHGGFGSRAESVIGDITLTSGTNPLAASGDISIVGGDGARAFAMVGHGGWDNDAINNDNGVDMQLRSGHITVLAGIDPETLTTTNANSSVNVMGGSGDYYSEWRQQGHFLGTAQRHVAGLGNSASADAGNTNPGLGDDNDTDDGRERRDRNGSEGSGEASAQIGHNGRSTRGTAVGHIVVRAANEVNVQGGDGITSYRNVDGQNINGSSNDYVEHENLFNEAGNPARIGHGGWDADGHMFGNIEVTATNDINLEAGAFKGAYAQVGHGGQNIANGWNWRDGSRTVNGVLPNDRPVISGDIKLASYIGSVRVEASTGLERNGFDFNTFANSKQMAKFLGHPSQSAYANAQIGHGGALFDVREDRDEGLTITPVTHDVGLTMLPTQNEVPKDQLRLGFIYGENTNNFIGGNTAADHDAELARHANYALGDLTTNIEVTAGVDLLLLGGTVERDAYAQIGHGGLDIDVVTAEGTIDVTVGRDLVAQRGNLRTRIGSPALGSLDGNFSFFGTVLDQTESLGNVTGSGEAYQQGGGVIGIAGGTALYGLNNQFAITNAYAKIGHGQHRYSPNSDVRHHQVQNGFSGTTNRRNPTSSEDRWEGDISVAAGNNATFNGVLVGHKDTNTANVGHGGVPSAIGNTYIGVGREDATGSDGILLTDNLTVFNSAIDDFFSELRIYAPTRANNQMAAGTILAGSSYRGTPALAAGQRGDEFVPYPDFTFVNGTNGEPVGEFINTASYSPFTSGGQYNIYYADLQTAVEGEDPFVLGSGPPVVPPVTPPVGGGGGGGDPLPAPRKPTGVLEVAIAINPPTRVGSPALPPIFSVLVSFDGSPLVFTGESIAELQASISETLATRGLERFESGDSIDDQIGDVLSGFFKPKTDENGRTGQSNYSSSSVGSTGSQFTSAAVSGDEGVFEPLQVALEGETSGGRVTISLSLLDTGLPPQPQTSAEDDELRRAANRASQSEESETGDGSVGGGSEPASPSPASDAPAPDSFDSFFQ